MLIIRQTGIYCPLPDHSLQVCPAGWFTDGPGSYVCTLTLAGFSADPPNKKDLQPCPPGTYSEEGALVFVFETGVDSMLYPQTPMLTVGVCVLSCAAGASLCTPCPPGTFAPSPTSTKVKQ